MLARDSTSVWGKDDCLTAAVGEFDRPEWLRAPTSAQAFANFRRIYGEDMKAAAVEIAAQYAPRFERLADSAAWQPGDVVVGKTAEYPFAIAVVGQSRLAIIRTEIGFSVVRFKEVFGVWRRAHNG